MERERERKRNNTMVAVYVNVKPSPYGLFVYLSVRFIHTFVWHIFIQSIQNSCHPRHFYKKNRLKMATADFHNYCKYKPWYVTIVFVLQVQIRIRKWRKASNAWNCTTYKLRNSTNIWHADNKHRTKCHSWKNCAVRNISPWKRVVIQRYSQLWYTIANDVDKK